MRYYIVDQIAGQIFQTDNGALAEQRSYSEDCWVIDSEAGEHILMGTVGERFPIPQAPE